jgi:hypothetical protein
MENNIHSNSTDDSFIIENVNIQTLVSARLKDLTNQISFLVANSQYRDAELLRQEGLALAKAMDDGTPFFYIPDLTGV